MSTVNCREGNRYAAAAALALAATPGRAPTTA